MDYERLYYLLICEKMMLETGINIDDSQIINDIKYYYNQNEDFRKRIRKFFGKMCFEKYDFNRMKEAFSLPNVFPYYKQKEIYKSLPFCINDKYYLSTINNIFPFSGPQPSYDNAIVLAKEYSNTDRYNELFDNMKIFLDNNPNLRKSTRKRYDGFVKEFQRFTDLHNGKKDEEDYCSFYNEFKQRNPYNDPTDANYENYLCGKCGEYVILELLQDKYNLEFVAGDLGDGFGYDIYYQEFLNGQYIEHLVEVKSTQDYSDADLLSISPTEMTNVKNCIQLNNTEYTVYRIFFPKGDRFKTFLYLLKYNEIDKTFSDSEKKLVYVKGKTDYSYINQNGIA